ATGKEQKVRIEQSSGLSKDEIEQMQKDAEAHAAEDKQKRELAETRNKAETLVYETEKLMKEHADKLDEGAKSAVESAMERVREAEKGEDVAALKSAIENLEQAMHGLSKHMYDAAQQAAGGDASAPPEEPTTSSTSDEDVIDAEFEKKE
ncbi:MAG: molecular chaperone DnaK, partial [Planctomycetota bacterium]